MPISGMIGSLQRETRSCSLAAASFQFELNVIVAQDVHPFASGDALYRDRDQAVFLFGLLAYSLRRPEGTGEHRSGLASAPCQFCFSDLF